MNGPIRIAARELKTTDVSIFRLKFHDGASIGPTLLKRIWSLAVGSEDVSVSRDSARAGLSSHDSYVVRALVRPVDLESVESNLRRLLRDRFSAAHIELRRLV
jgi:hypothetical protein